MFRPIDSGGAGDITLAYERRGLMLAALVRIVLIGLSKVVRCLVGASEGDIKDGKRQFIGVISGVASRSRRLMSCARSFVAASDWRGIPLAFLQLRRNECIERVSCQEFPTGNALLEGKCC